MISQPIIDLMLYVIAPCVLGLWLNTYAALARAIAILCLLAAVPQMLLDLSQESVIPGIAYLLSAIPALLIATLAFVAKRFMQRKRRSHGNNA